MDNPTFVDEENISIVQDEDCDDYKTSDTSRIDDGTPFIEPDTTEATSILRLRQKVKRDKINTLYRHLNVTGNLDLIDLDRFRLTKNLKIGNTDLLFLDGNKHWQSLTNKPTCEFLAVKTLREKFGGLNIMKSVLRLDETPSALERSFKAATKLRLELSLPTNLEMESIPLEKLSSLVDGIHVRREKHRKILT